MFATNNLRLRQSVGIAPVENGVEFFNANTRSMLSLRMNSHGVIEFLNSFDGVTSFYEICNKYPEIPKGKLEDFVSLLMENYIIIEHDKDYSEEEKKNYRMLNILEDYFHRTSDVKKAINKINAAKVVVVGMGAVGSMVSLLLSKDGVKNFILIDPDTVDISNIHRQAFCESDVGLSKAKAIKQKIIRINKDSVVDTLELSVMSDAAKSRILNYMPDVIINCADYPSVDETSKFISELAMKESIPHIIGGGYNLHLTLIGQTIIPFESACYECFNEKLKKINDLDFRNVKRLNISNRKLGSFSPLSGVAATLAALDAFKVIIGSYKFLQQTNKRIEFNSREWKLSIIDVEKSNTCSWCGVNGKFVLSKM